MVQYLKRTWDRCFTILQAQLSDRPIFGQQLHSIWANILDGGGIFWRSASRVIYVVIEWWKLMMFIPFCISFWFLKFQVYDDYCTPLVYLEKTICIALLLVAVDYQVTYRSHSFTPALTCFPRKKPCFCVCLNISIVLVWGWFLLHLDCPICLHPHWLSKESLILRLCITVGFISLRYSSKTLNQIKR